MILNGLIGISKDCIITTDKGRKEAHLIKSGDKILVSRIPRIYDDIEYVLITKSVDSKLYISIENNSIIYNTTHDIYNYEFCNKSEYINYNFKLKNSNTYLTDDNIVYTPDHIL